MACGGCEVSAKTCGPSFWSGSGGWRAFLLPVWNVAETSFETTAENRHSPGVISSSRNDLTHTGLPLRGDA
eukprot:6526909-Prymnesium_polylepis.1